ncbi:hypothetical protein GCM10028807_07820 [Spirosoma daeguense]
MKINLFAINLFFCLLLCGGVHYVSVAQNQSQRICGTEISPEQAKALQQQVILALKQKMATNNVFTTLTYIPIRPHIIRRSDGTGGLDLARLNSALAAANRSFMTNGLGIQFYFAGETPHYLSDDNLYTNFPYTNQSALDPYDASNAMNQYYPNSINAPSSSFAFYPSDDIRSTRSIISINTRFNFNQTVAHELGHNFSLIHTHGTTSGMRTNELVTRGAGANCTIAGDQICDTPADPFVSFPEEFQYTDDADGCMQYSPDNTLRDANGDPYTPLVNNIMSYYNFTTCPEEFTSGQYERIQAGLAIRQGHTAYTLDYPAANVPHVTNLTATINGLWVQLSWQDNASNEMGYLIERSTLPTTGFVSISGVEPDVTSFTDRSIMPNTTYYYRIRPSNTTTGSLSQNATITTPAMPPVTGLTTTNITGNGAKLIWNSLGDGVEYEVQYRQVGVTTWNTVRHISSPITPIGFLASNTTYEWQVKAALGTTYSGPVTFTTICEIPANLFSSPERMRAQLSWVGANDQTYTLQWRPAGSSDWTTINNLTVNTYTLSELTSVTAYEWRVQGVCLPAFRSEFSNPQSFTTRACQLPYSSSLNAVGGDWASLSWFFSVQDPARTLDLRYRPIGTPIWTTVNSLSITNTTGTYQLTGLTNNTTYEWQVRSVCSSTEQTDYASPSSFSFTTLCRTPVSLTANASATQAQLGWQIIPYTQTGTTFIVQYRPIGMAEWATVTSTTTTFAGGSAKLTGLTTGTTYQWRVQTTCSPAALSDFSTIAQFTTNCTVPLTNGFSVAFITPNSAQLNWTITDDPLNHYDIRYRPVGSPNWSTTSTLGTTITLTGLTDITTYEWQLRTICSGSESAGFTAGPNFTTYCRVPIFRYVNPQITSATLNWELISPNTAYTIQYRRSGTAAWTTISNVSSASYVVTNLTGNTTYEWIVGVICPNSIGYASGANFTTYGCGVPSISQTTNITTNSAQLNWFFSYPNADTRYQARYRAVGAFDWVMLDNLTSNNSQGSRIINDLSGSTTYEWQIRAICSASENSAFTSSSRFQTSIPCSTMYTIRTGLWNDPGTWSCNRIPATDDTVQIKHPVIIPASYVANARRINYDAAKPINYGSSAQLKLGF